MIELCRQGERGYFYVSGTCVSHRTVKHCSVHLFLAACAYSYRRLEHRTGVNKPAYLAVVHEKSILAQHLQFHLLQVIYVIFTTFPRKRIQNERLAEPTSIMHASFFPYNSESSSTKESIGSGMPRLDSLLSP